MLGTAVVRVEVVITGLEWRDAASDGAPQRRFFQSGPAVRLHANEHPYPPPPEVLSAIAEWSFEANCYPFGNEDPLVRMIAERAEVRPDQILLAAGSNELLYRAIASLGGPRAEVVIPSPSYPTFAAAPGASSARVVPVPLLSTGACDADGLLSAVTERTTCVVVCNPNNPTGAAMPSGALEGLVRDLPQSVLVIVDEAYYEYTEAFACRARGALDLFSSGRSILVTRTFSKFFALAGVRLGYGIVPSADLAADLRAHIGPNAVSALALRAGQAALRAEQIYLERLREQKQERLRLWQGLAELGLKPMPTETNFVCCEEPDPETSSWLASKGVNVRSGDSISAPGHLRITVGSPESNEQVIALLAERVVGQSATKRESRHREPD